MRHIGYWRTREEQNHNVMLASLVRLFGYTTLAKTFDIEYNESPSSTMRRKNASDFEWVKNEVVMLQHKQNTIQLAIPVENSIQKPFSSRIT